MNNLYLLLILLFIFFMLIIGQIFKIKKEIRKLSNIVEHLLNKIKQNDG